MKAFKSPPALVKKVLEAVAVMLGMGRDNWSKTLQGPLYDHI